MFVWLWAGCNKTSATLVCFQKYFKRSYMTNLSSRGRSWKGNGCRAWTRSDYCAPAGTQPHNIRHWILTFLGHHGSHRALFLMPCPILSCPFSPQPSSARWSLPVAARCVREALALQLSPTPLHQTLTQDTAPHHPTPLPRPQLGEKIIWKSIILIFRRQFLFSVNAGTRLQSCRIHIMFTRKSSLPLSAPGHQMFETFTIFTIW